MCFRGQGLIRNRSFRNRSPQCYAQTASKWSVLNAIFAQERRKWSYQLLMKPNALEAHKSEQKALSHISLITWRRLSKFSDFHKNLINPQELMKEIYGKSEFNSQTLQVLREKARQEASQEGTPTLNSFQAWRTESEARRQNRPCCWSWRRIISRRTKIILSSLGNQVLGRQAIVEGLAQRAGSERRSSRNRAENVWWC